MMLWSGRSPESSRRPLSPAVLLLVLLLFSRAAPRTLRDTRPVSRRGVSDSLSDSLSDSVTHLSDSRPQNRTWKTRTLGRQQATRIRKSLSMRRHLWQDAATAATLLLLLQQTGSLIGSLLVAGHMTRLRLKPQHKNLTCD